MLLLTLWEWIGPQHRKITEPEYSQTKVTERYVSMATRLPLGKALERIAAYEVAYKERYFLAVEFRLLSVAKIENLNDEQLECGRIDLVESLKQQAEDF